MAKKSSIYTPGNLLVRLFILILVIWASVCWIIGIASSSGKRWAGSPPFQARAQFKSIQRRLSPQAAEKMGKIFPEGRLFTYSFYGFSLLNMATALPEIHEFRKTAIKELERIIPVVEKQAKEAPFDICNKMVPSGGAIGGGHANLLRAGYALLGGRNAKIIRDFHSVSAASYQEFMHSKSGIMESYPEESWPVDNCCILESIRLHDVLYKTDYSAALVKWSKSLRSNRDPEAGMIASQIALNGLVLDGPRGCALSWMLAFLPSLDPELAKDQYARYRKDWFVPIWGFMGIREWPRGKERLMDADSGPVIGGIGAAASGLGIAAAKANEDWSSLGALLRGVEMFGFPSWTIHGEKRYFGEMVLLADILALWGKTMRPWDRPADAGIVDRWQPKRISGFWKSLTLLTLFVSTIIGILGWGTIRAMLCFTKNEHWCRLERWPHSSRMYFLAQCFVLGVWFSVPPFNWFFAVLGMAVIDVIDRKLLTASHFWKKSLTG